MATIRDMVSELQTDLKAYNLDQHVSKRYIYSKLKDATSFIIKREELIKMFRQRELFVPINCFEMEEVPLISCCNVDIPTCDTVMRSKNKLPKLFANTFINNFLLVTNVKGTMYNLTTPSSYQRIMDQEYRDKSQKYYWIAGEYIIIPEGPEVISVSGIFIESEEAKKLSSCYDSKEDINSNGYCKTKLDNNFNCPEHLLFNVKDMALSSLLKAFAQIPNDDNPNGNSNN